MKNDIRHTLNQLDEIVAGWKDADMVSAIERDIVLAKLRELYERVISYGSSRTAVADKEPIPVVVPQLSIDIEEIAASQPDVKDSDFDLSDSLQADQKPLADEEPFLPESCLKPEIPQRKKIDRDTIMSLYCDEPRLDTDGQPEAAECEIVADVVEKVPVVDAEEPKTTQIDASQHMKILGDVIGGNDKVLGDTLSNGVDKTDVASKIVSQQSTGLRKSIGVNDRFLLIRDLFGSSAMEYDATINKLEEFEDINEAMLYIYENYQWDPNNEAVKLLVELLTRKLS